MTPRRDDGATRVVIYRLGSLGDTVVALPCLHSVAAAFPHAQKIVLTNQPVNAKAVPMASILEGTGLADRYLSYPVGTRSVRALAELRASLVSLHADTLVYLTASRGLRAAWRDHAFFTLCGFKRIIGIPLSEDLQAHRRQSDGSLEPECERLRRCLAPLSPLSLDDPAAWNLKLSASEWAAAAAALAPAAGAPRLAINMGGKVAINDWGEARWSALIGRLRGLLDGHALTIVGSAEDAGRAERVGAGWPGPVLNLCGRLPPRVTAAALSGSALFIGHNSGPLHLASCVGVPCVGLYGNHFAPRIWHPYGGPAAGDRHRILHDMRGVEHLTVEQVLDATLAALAPVPRRVEPRALSVVSVVSPAGPPSPTSATSATSVASLAAAVGGAGS